ncbi:DWNN domain-containing protein [Rhodofomes roseus]|uniref:DWNN domain-containing protein n=1 Tax=Rhodofomes roseus TaxID=34475 RepID=A0ABQ8KPD8_9APHY|nr:DWNN domain-containing protein [Rhodofomes roseus]KAH9840254.1 DWNN domain-containing protein [Rhodofomes roseus]
MASSVFYKFKSQRDESRVTFDGTGISVFDLKKEIILANNLAKANDFDLVICDNSSGEEIKDDSHIIPRSSSVLVKRVFVRPGKGKTAMYVGNSAHNTKAFEPSSRTGGSPSTSSTWSRPGNISKRFDGKVEEGPAQAAPKTHAPATAVKSAVTKDDEAAAMAAMFQAQTQNWEETQEKMSQLVSRLRGFLVSVVDGSNGRNFTGAFCLCLHHFHSAVRIHNNSRGAMGRGGKPFHHHQSDRPLPASYVCYRCGQKGHWIQDCPTNNDRDYDNRPRIKRTTGIPRSFLKAVESPNGQIGQGVMVTPEGGYVVAQPDVVSWQKQVAKHKPGLTEADIRERTPSDPSLVCPIDNKLFRDAVKTPCCGTLYCEECIQTHLLERDFICPKCGAKIASLDKLLMDKPMRTRVGDYIDREVEKSRHEPQEEPKGETPEPVYKVRQDKVQDQSDGAAFDQEYYSDQQPGGDMDMSHIFAETIPQLQAQISQIQIMLNNPSLPPQVRQQTQMKHQQLQMELQQAQVAAAMAATLQAASSSAAAMPFNGMQGGYQQDFRQQWTNPFPNQQPASQDSAYQRLPLNNRRRNHLKRERPSDFLEVAGNEPEPKMQRYWE